MSTVLTIAFFVVVLGFVAITDADVVGVDFPENAKSRMGGSRILSGWPAEPGQWPWQVHIRMISNTGQASSCGGSIIHEEWALTAAHCTALRFCIVVRAGLVNTTSPTYIFETYTHYNHPLFNDHMATVVQPNDISLIPLGRKISFSTYLQPIRLQPSMDMYRNYEGEILVASGYGQTWTNGVGTEHLNWVYLRGVSNWWCWVEMGFHPIVVDSSVCGVFYNVTSQSICMGDSGGPLSVVEQDGKRSLIGIAAFVSANCHMTHPSGFVRPGFYHDWIYEITGVNFDWSWDEFGEESFPQHQLQ